MTLTTMSANSEIVCSASPGEADLALGLGLKRDFEQRVYTVADVEHIAPLFAFAVNGQVLALQRKPNKEIRSRRRRCFGYSREYVCQPRRSRGRRAPDGR